ncbi:MAG: hypothetical protein U0457_14660 [Candidatus Sericytochromatia bacterium]
MNNNVAKISFISLLIAFLLTFNAFADDRKLPRPPIESTNSLAINWGILNLTVQQKEKMRLMNIDFQKVSIKLKADIDLKQIEIEKLLISPHSNSEQIRKIMKDKLALESKLRMEALENFLQKKALLTTDQLAKLPTAVNSR